MTGADGELLGLSCARLCRLVRWDRHSVASVLSGEQAARMAASADASSWKQRCRLSASS